MTDFEKTIKREIITRDKFYETVKPLLIIFGNDTEWVQYPTRDAYTATLVWPPVQFVKWTAYVFAKDEGSYRFFGTYESDRIATAGDLGLKIQIKPNEPVEVFKRINKKAELPVVSKTN